VPTPEFENRPYLLKDNKPVLTSIIAFSHLNQKPVFLQPLSQG
jgi:hypothetical protein